MRACVHVCTLCSDNCYRSVKEQLSVCIFVISLLHVDICLCALGFVRASVLSPFNSRNEPCFNCL